MPRRPVRNPGSNRARASSNQTHASASQTSPAEVEDEVNRIPIASLTLNTPFIPFRPKRRASPPSLFSFLELPSELRLRIYSYYFEDTNDEVLDLGPDVYKRLHKWLGIVRVCKQVHAEVTHYFYSTRSFRIFPTYPGRYFKAKKPLLARLKPVQRECLTSLELRVGPGFNAPPKGWVVNEALGLKECANVRRLNVFVECDPSDGIFKGFRRSEGFYEAFSRELLDSVLKDMPAVDVVVFDAYPGVKKSGDMMQQLLHLVAEKKLLIRWGPDRGWTDDDDDANTSAVARFSQAISIPDHVAQNIMGVA